MENITKDMNNNIIEIGDIVRIANSPVKNDNATYIVAQDGTSDFYSGSGLTMYKVVKGKNGYSISRCKYNICFWPLVCFSSKYKYTRAELNTATIEILVKNNPGKVEIKMRADSWENPCEEWKEKDLYYHCAIETAEGKEIEDISFLCSQVEKLQQFLSNITLKTDETINIFKACNTDFYYKRTSYEAIYTADAKETTEEETTTEVETVTEQEEATQETEENLPFKTVKNNDLMRLQLLFNGKPSEEIRTILKSNGFRWSPSQKAWQRLLNDNALYSLKRVSEAITSIA